MKRASALGFFTESPGQSRRLKNEGRENQQLQYSPTQQAARLGRVHIPQS